MPSPPTPIPSDRTSLLKIATAARHFIEPIWMEWHRHAGADRPTIASQGTCGRTSLFLQRVLSTQGFSADWVCGTPRSGPLEPEIGPFGFNCGKSWQSHAWVECGDFIVDITADQFGAPPVLVVDRTDNRYNKGNRDGALPEFVLARRRAVDDIWPQWQRISAGGPKGSLTP
ncbi:hypothetical protein N182_17975 [Sinorhizobium sp. GL2]|nr:hypothetical protein N182_17975 [Sinorhizobium sp. GL2]